MRSNNLIGVVAESYRIISVTIKAAKKKKTVIIAQKTILIFFIRNPLYRRTDTNCFNQIFARLVAESSHSIAGLGIQALIVQV
jgi:hypothetical protein